MGRKFRKVIIAGLAITTLIAGCGKTEKVEGIKGPQGDKGQQGERGEKGDRGEQGIPAPIPTVTVTQKPNPDSNNTNLPPTIPYPPIIIVLPSQQCNRTICPQGTMLVCACIDGDWKTISIAPHDVSKVRIRNYGRCEDYYRRLESKDCIWWPREQPQPTITAIPIPVPTVTVTAYPMPMPKPNQC